MCPFSKIAKSALSLHPNVELLHTVRKGHAKPGSIFTFNARERRYFISVSSCVSIAYNIIRCQILTG